jgi:hypothetical protein
MKKRTKILGIALALAAILTLAIGVTVFADAPGNGEVQEYCGGNTGWRGFNGNGGVISDTVSEFLGLTEEEIHDLRLEGYSLVEIAELEGIDINDLVEAIVAEKAEALEAKVADGTLTRERAEWMVQQMTERTIEAVNRTGEGPTSWSKGGGGMNGSGICGSSANRWGDQDTAGTGGRSGSGMGRMGENTY